MAWDGWIGRNETRTDLFTPQLLERFCATLDLAPAGDIAPQGIHWCLCPPAAPTASLGTDGHPRRDDSADGFLPPVPLPRRMWASSKVEFLAPIPVAAEIERASTIAGITEKSGSSGALVFVDVDHETHANGIPAVRERQTIVYREANLPSRLREGSEAGLSQALTHPPLTPPAGGRGTGWPWHRTVMPSEPLLLRYSALTFNSHRIHYDRPYATQAEGYPGLVVHGPLTATLLLDLAARELGCNSLASFSFRGQSPAIVGEPLHLAGRIDGNAITLSAMGEDGRVIMSAEANLKP